MFSLVSPPKGRVALLVLVELLLMHMWVNTGKAEDNRVVPFNWIPKSHLYFQLLFLGFFFCIHPFRGKKKKTRKKSRKYHSNIRIKFGSLTTVFLSVLKCCAMIFTVSENCNKSLWSVGASAILCKLLWEQKGRTTLLKTDWKATVPFIRLLSLPTMELKTLLGHTAEEKKLFKKMYIFKKAKFK